MGYLPKCACGGAPAMLVFSGGCWVKCWSCPRGTGIHRSQAGAAGEWREMCLAPRIPPIQPGAMTDLFETTPPQSGKTREVRDEER